MGIVVFRERVEVAQAHFQEVRHAALPERSHYGNNRCEPRCKRSRAVRFLQRTAAGADKALRNKEKTSGDIEGPVYFDGQWIKYLAIKKPLAL